jgi:hypothetical protein
MTAAAVQMLPRERSSDVHQEFGVLVERAGARARVALRGGERWAEIAPSCLLAPATGDRVLVVHGGEEAYVLAVVKRAAGAEARLTFDRDVSIEAPAGRLKLTAQEGMEITSKRVRLVTEAFDTIAGRIYQRAINFLRRTDELDRVEAKNIDRRAERLLHVHGDNAVTTADHLVKIDGSQVHVG